jgi:RHS repeat-associated protein
VLTYFHGDWLDSTRYTSTAAGTLNEQLRYDAWGNRFWLNHLDPNNPANPFNPFHPTDFQWAGGFGYQTETAYPSEPGLGLDYLEQRYYDPLLGRFISQDPIGYFGGDNLFEYSEDDPVNGADPSGTGGPDDWKDIEDSAFLLRQGLAGGVDSRVMHRVNDIHERFGYKRYRSGDRPLVRDVMDIWAATVTAGLGPSAGGSGPFRGGSSMRGGGSRAPGIATRLRLWLARKTGRGTGYPTFAKLKQAIGSAGRGRAWYHIVEEHDYNIAKFGACRKHNTSNIISLPDGSGTLHNAISAFYSSKRPRITGPGFSRVRDWIKLQSFEEQRRFGLWVIREISAGRLR